MSIVRRLIRALTRDRRQPPSCVRFDPDLGGTRHLIRTDPTSWIGHTPEEH